MVGVGVMVGIGEAIGWIMVVVKSLKVVDVIVRINI